MVSKKFIVIFSFFIISCSLRNNDRIETNIPNPASNYSWRVKFRNQRWIVFEMDFGADSPSRIYVARLEAEEPKVSRDFIQYSKLFYSTEQIVVEPLFYKFNEEGFPVVAFGSYGLVEIKK